MAYNEVTKYLQKAIYPFHMPGHKRNPDFLPPNLLELDMTELPEMDVLSNPKKGLKDMQRRFTEIYDTKQTFLLVNGSTAGITAAILATCNQNTTIMVPRNAHKSVYNAIFLSGATPQYVMPEITEDGLAGGVSPQAFANMPQGAVALVVSPTYEGFISDIAGISKVVKERGGTLIVDAAHGAHLKFMQRAINSDIALSAMMPGDEPSGPKSLEGKYFSDTKDIVQTHLGADIVIESLHKTLPMLGQTATLHITKTSNVDPGYIQGMINAVQTSSPSYILMAAADFALDKLRSNPILFTSYLWRLEALRSKLPSMVINESIRLRGEEMLGKHGIYALDPSKLLFYHPVQPGDLRLTEHVLAEIDGVAMEMAAGNHILAMTTVADTPEGFAKLEKAIERLNQANMDFEPNPETLIIPTIPEMVLTPREAMQIPSVEVPWKESLGKVSAQIIAKTPPGIAIVAPGERIPDTLPPGIFTDSPFRKETVRIVPNV